jgi:hypothetical protein
MQKKLDGDQKLQALEASFNNVKASTNAKGVETLQADFKRLAQLWRSLADDAGEYKRVLKINADSLCYTMLQ